MVKVDSPKQLTVICPQCKKEAVIQIERQEIEQAEEKQDFIQKAILHDDHVVVVHIDFQCRVRRTYAYPVENISEDDRKKMKLQDFSGKSTDVGNILDQMLKKSKKNAENVKKT